MAEGSRSYFRRRRPLRTCLVLASVFALAALWGYRHLNGLVVIPTPPVQVFPKPNAYDFYLTAQKEIVDAKAMGHSAWSLQYHPWAADIIVPSHDVVIAFVKQNPAALSGIRAGLKYACIIPRDRSGDPGMNDDLRYLLALDSYVKTWHGDWEGAFDADLDGIEVDNALDNGTTIRPDWQEKLLGDFGHLSPTAKHRALARFERLDNSRQTFGEELQELKWYRLSRLSVSLRNPRWRNDYVAAPTLKNFTNPRVFSPWWNLQFVNPQVVINHAVTWFDRSMAVVRQPYALKLPFPAPPTDPVNRYLPEICQLSWISFLTVQTAHNLMRTTLALETYHSDHGKYPATLAELVPSYLSAVPDDPFALRAPLRYRRRGPNYLLYSIGYDTKDDGGVVAITGREIIDNRLGPLPLGDFVAGKTHYFF